MYLGRIIAYILLCLYLSICVTSVSIPIILMESVILLWFTPELMCFPRGELISALQQSVGSEAQSVLYGAWL